MPSIRFYIPNSSGFTTGININGKRVYIDFKPQQVGNIKAAIYTANTPEMIEALRSDPYNGKKWFEIKDKDAKREVKPVVKFVAETVVSAADVDSTQKAKKYLVNNKYCKPTDFKKLSVAEIAQKSGVVFEWLQKEAPNS